MAGRVRDRALAEAPPSDDSPPVDPSAVREAYRRARARRRAREHHERAARHAGIRFWIVTIALLVAAGFIAVTFWREVQELFGL